MRKVIGLVLVGTGLLLAQAPCPNLSGRYRVEGEDGQVLITVAQQGCYGITIERQTDYLGKFSKERHRLVLDGKWRADSPWFGGLDKWRTSAKFAGSLLKVHIIGPSGSTVEVWYGLTPDRNLFEKTSDDDSNRDAPVGIRQK